MSSNAKRLAAAVKARREELDLSQLDVWQQGGPSNTTLTKIESGQLESLARVTARKLDAGLRWQEGSARNVWAGGEAVPLGDEDDWRAAIDALNLSPENYAHIVATIEQDRAAKRAKERGVG